MNAVDGTDEFPFRNVDTNEIERWKAIWDRQNAIINRLDKLISIISTPNTEEEKTLEEELADVVNVAKKMVSKKSKGK